MTRYFEPLIIKAFAHFDPTATDKKILEGYLATVRAKLMEWHRNLKHGDELSNALTNSRINLAITLAKKIKWRISQAERNKDDDKFYEKLQHAKSVRIAALLPGPIKHNRTECPFCTGTSKLTMAVRGNFTWCFRCNKGWDTIDLVKELQGCTFLEAVERLQGF